MADKRINEFPAGTIQIGDVLPVDSATSAGTTRKVAADNVMLRDGTAPPTADFDVGGNNVTNVGLVDGVDVGTELIRRDGSVAMTGALDMGGQQVTNVGNVDGVDVSAHGSRHGPNGADAPPVGSPIATGRSNQAGSTNSFVRSDHVHDGGVVAVTTVTAATHNLTDAQDVLLLDTTSNTIDIQLHTPGAPRFWTLKKTVLNTSGINLLRAGSEDVEGAASDFLLPGSDDDTIRASWTIVYDGADWWVF